MMRSRLQPVTRRIGYSSFPPETQISTPTLRSDAHPCGDSRAPADRARLDQRDRVRPQSDVANHRIRASPGGWTVARAGYSSCSCRAVRAARLLAVQAGLLPGAD